MPTLTNWPIDPAFVCRAIGYPSTALDDPDTLADLDDWASFISDKVDRDTGRHLDPLRHLVAVTVDPDTGEVTEARVPSALRMAARVAARLLWQQEMNGPLGQQAEPVGVPMGADLPAKAKAWLAQYPPAPGIA